MNLADRGLKKNNRARLTKFIDVSFCVKFIMRDVVDEWSKY